MERLVQARVWRGPSRQIQPKNRQIQGTQAIQVIPAAFSGAWLPAWSLELWSAARRDRLLARRTETTRILDPCARVCECVCGARRAVGGGWTTWMPFFAKLRRRYK